MKKILIILILVLTPKLFGQACCTAGTPLLSSLETASTPNNFLQFGLSYRYNSITSLYENDIFLNDNGRERIAKSVILQIDYGLSEKFSITTLFSYVMQKRKITTLVNSENLLETKGFGDGLFLLKYNIIPLTIVDELEFSVGTGIKIPFGNSQLKHNDFLIPADMQPGTGTWDFLAWIYFSKGHLFEFPLSFVFNLSYKSNGKNNRFNVDGFNYKFGNELITQIGATYRTDYITDFTLFLRYRNAQNDLSSNFEIPNTGGNWIYLVPGINFKFDDSKTIRISGEIPIYVNVIGTQLTTSFTSTLAFYYSLNL